MIETIEIFGANIWQWCLDNKDGISAFFMSGQFVSLIGALVMLVKNIKQVKANTSSTLTLDKTLTNTNKMSDGISTLSFNVEKLENENAGLREELKTTQEKLSESQQLITDKLNSILEVQSIVYSTIRDDSVRQTVNKILNNARYCEINFKEQLQEQIDELKHEFEHTVDDMNHKMNDAVNKVEHSINAGDNARIRAQSIYGNQETTRY